ncbi:hypothetical protein [Georgenia sp. AZ-5]|uniref:hypothetical protein n=1 Tax=Georgenia sp. AZ-5 TaxID=3367526 RepID=UPI003754D2AA
MRKITSLAAATALALTGIGLTLPASAETASEDAAGTGQSLLADRLERIRDALTELVDGGTLTEDQADAVAETLNDSEALGPYGGPGVHGGGLDLDAAADALGLSAEDLRSQLEAGGTLADVAEAQGVDVAALVDALVQAATDRLDAAVADGGLTQEQADERKAGLENRITTAVEQGLPAGGRHHGMHGRGTPPDGSDDDTTTGSDDGTTTGSDDGTTTGSDDGTTTGSDDGTGTTGTVVTSYLSA